MKNYVCKRCGLKFEGRYDYCPKCGQHFVYKRGEEYFDALGTKVTLNKKGHIKKFFKNKNAPK